MCCVRCSGLLIDSPFKYRRKYCKSCKVIVKKEQQRRALQKWRSTHKDKLQAQRKRHRMRFPEREAVRTRRYRQEHAAEFRMYAQRRRTRYLAAFVEDVDHIVLWFRDRGICGICKLSVSIKHMHVDHIVALVNGGLHSYANCQTAHKTCNLRKNMY